MQCICSMLTLLSSHLSALARSKSSGSLACVMMFAIVDQFYGHFLYNLASVSISTFDLEGVLLS
jgi:hypothetical protein